MNPHNQLTAAAGEIATELCIKFSPTYFKAVDTISTNPTLVAIAKENEYLKSIISGNAETEIRQLQTKCTELQERVRELEKRLCPEPFQQGCSHEQISEALNQTTKI